MVTNRRLIGFLMSSLVSNVLAAHRAKHRSLMNLSCSTRSAVISRPFSNMAMCRNPLYGSSAARVS
jgi:hypothetical protein